MCAFVIMVAIAIYTNSFLFVVLGLFLLCRCSYDLVLSSSLRTELTTTYITYLHTHFNLENAASHAGKHLTDAVEQKKNKYRGSFPATYSLLPLAMPTCDEVGSDVHTLIKELVIRRVEHRSEIYPNESLHLAERTEVARLWRRFSLFYNKNFHSARVTISADRGRRLQAPDSSVHKAWCLYTRIAPRG